MEEIKSVYRDLTWREEIREYGGMSWREEISNELEVQHEEWKDVVISTLSEGELDMIFGGTFGDEIGKPFTLWTKNRVYFPVEHDGSQWVASVSRNPDGKPTLHLGDVR